MGGSGAGLESLKTDLSLWSWRALPSSTSQGPP